MKGHRVVVDADVGRAAASADAAGRGASVSARALAMRATLHAFERSNLILVLSPTLRSEWREHVQKGTAGHRFLVSMAARRRVLRPPDDGDVAGVVRAAEATLPPKDAAVATKDAHVVAAAIAHGDRRIVSGDRAAREKFVRVAAAKPWLQSILWADAAEGSTATWLEEHAPASSAWRLTPPP